MWFGRSLREGTLTALTIEMEYNHWKKEYLQTQRKRALPPNDVGLASMHSLGSETHLRGIELSSNL